MKTIIVNLFKLQLSHITVLELLHRDVDKIRTCKTTGLVENVFIPNDKKVQFELIITLKVTSKAQSRLKM